MHVPTIIFLEYKQLVPGSSYYTFEMLIFICEIFGPFRERLIFRQ